VCDLEASKMRRPWPNRGCPAKEKYCEQNGLAHRVCLSV